MTTTQKTEYNLKNITESENIASRRIDRIEVTNDTLTTRAGFTPFVRYLERVDIYPHLERLFGSLRKNRKSILLWYGGHQFRMHIVLYASQS